MKKEEMKRINLLHCKLRKNNKKTKLCLFCKSTNAKAYHFALIKGHEYSSDINDYYELCAKCHKNYDMTDEFKVKCSKRMIGVNRGNHPSARGISKFDINGNLIKSYPSITSAVDAGYKKWDLWLSLSGTKDLYNNFKWKYNEERKRK